MTCPKHPLITGFHQPVALGSENSALFSYGWCAEHAWDPSCPNHDAWPGPLAAAAHCQGPPSLASPLGRHHVQAEKSKRLRMCDVSYEKTEPAQENQFSASKVSAE